jgi:UDP-N-acetylglucosamine 2-epimerase (non-hydrolysing)
VAKNSTASFPRLSIILGTRPEVIKLVPVILEARKRGIPTRVILTGQHRTMARDLLQAFGIKPDFDLNVMRPGQTLTGLTARVLENLDSHEKEVIGDIVLVQGDTTTAWTSAYWAFCKKIPVAHIEAGLRTYDLYSPFPEEANRQLISRIATLHFAPTAGSAAALRSEGISRENIATVGNTAIDSVFLGLDLLKKSKAVPRSERLSPEILGFIAGKPFALITAHRRESFGAGFEEICAGILEIARRKPEVRFVYPVHPNPEVRRVVNARLANHPSILLCEPQPYFAFLQLMAKADLILTDSGGVQEEAPSLGKRILVLRETTERPEGVKAGFSKLVGTNPKRIVSESLRALASQKTMPRRANPYGDGKSAARIVNGLIRFHRAKA